jgi:hypothetical protein
VYAVRSFAPGAKWRERSCILIVRRQSRFNQQSGTFTVNSRSNFGAAKILCVELDVAVLESRCAVLKYSGYDAASATPQVAEIALRSQKFDLIVISRLRGPDLHRIINLADGANVLVLDDFTMPSELLSSAANYVGHPAAHQESSMFLVRRSGLLQRDDQ